MDKNDFLNYLCFKYFILNYSADEIVELIDNFNSDEPYEMFYDLIVATSDVDPDFFVIDDSIIDKIQTVISEYRFRDEYRIDNPDYDEMFNSVIVYLNEMKALARTDMVSTIANYTAREMNRRSIVVRDLDTLMTIMGMDYEIYANIANNNFTEVTKLFVGEVTNYFLECCPEVYEDSDVYNNTIDILESIDFNKMSRAEAKHTKKVLKRMNNLK